MRARTTAGTPTGAAAVLAVAGLLLVALVTVWAASSGGDAVLSGDGPARLRAETSSPTPTPSESVTADPLGEREPPGEAPALFAAVAYVVVAAAWLLLGGLVLLVVRALWRRARAVRREPAPAPVDVELLDQPALVAAQMRRDATAHRALLEEGEPRTAIEACWHRFEVQAREAGLPREPWETSSEFTYRMLDLVGADPHAASTLGELYREARFSEHPVGEDARAAARAALDALHVQRVAAPGDVP